MTKQSTSPIREKREGLNLSQYDLAKRSDLHPTTISLAERGCRVSTETIQKIAAALGVAPAEIAP